MTTKNRFYTHLAISLLLFSVLLWACFYIFDLLEKKSANLLEAKVALIEVQKKREKVAKVAEDYFLLEDKIKRFESSLLVENEDLKFVLLIEDAAKLYSLNHETNILDKKADKKALLKNSLTFQVNASGSFSNILDFMEYIENALHRSAITSISFDRVKSDTLLTDDKTKHPLEKNDIRASFLIKVYIF